MKNWKPFVLGLALLESGVIGFVGTLIACASKAERLSYHSVFQCVRGADWLLVLGFAAAVVAGAIKAIREGKRE